MTLISSVRDSGAQKSESGINSLPSDQLHSGVREHSVATCFSTQSFQMASDVHVPSEFLTLAGWQNSLEKSGISTGLTGVVTSFFP
jgi:hypothetical protein